MDTDIGDLMREFEEVQSTDVSHILSERTVVELVSKLMEKNKISVLNTRSGIREFVTWKDLETEIIEETDSHDGRISLEELEDATNIDIIYIEKSAKALCDSDCGIEKLNNQEIINSRYTDMITKKCIDIVKQKGTISIGLLATRFNVPVSYLNNSVIPAIISTCRSIESKQGNLFTSAYNRRNQCRARGVLSAVDKPVQISELCDFHNINESLMQETLSEMKKNGELLGSVTSGSFIPFLYENAKNNSVIGFLRDNQYISKKMLYDNKIKDVNLFCSRNGYSDIIELDTVWICRVLADSITATVTEFCNEDGFIELSTIFPSPFTQQDQIIVLKMVEKIQLEFDVSSRSIYCLLGEYVVLSSIMEETLNHFLKDMETTVYNLITKNGLNSIIPSSDLVLSYIQSQRDNLDALCIQNIIDKIDPLIQKSFEDCHKQQLLNFMKGDNSNRKLDRKEVSNSLRIFFQDVFDTVRRMQKLSKSNNITQIFEKVEKDLKTEGVCLVIRFIQYDQNITPMDSLIKMNINDIRAIIKMLPKDTQDFVLALLNESRGIKEKEIKIEEIKEEEGRKQKKSKGKEKKKAHEEVEEEKEIVRSYIDIFVQVTDFGGPLFKLYDRKQLRQILMSSKTELQQQLDLVILQSAGDKDIIHLASLAMNLKYSVIPYVPSTEVAHFLLLDYADNVEELERDSYIALVNSLFGCEDTTVIQQNICDLIKIFMKKE